PMSRCEQVAEDNVRLRKHRRVVLTGGEVTLEKKLFDYIAVARRGNFEHIRVQTNGRPLKDRAFTQSLIDAGVDEFFVSLHGHDADTQDYISQRPGSIDDAIAGIRYF